MQISDAQKMIALMLCDIADALKMKEGFSPDFIRESITSGNTWAISDRYVGWGLRTNERNPIRSQVIDHLDMWWFIENAYKNFDAEQHARYAELSEYKDAPQFLGYDGNNESDYMGMVRFLADHMDIFPEYSGRQINSHCPMVETYDRMYSLFEKIRPTLGDRKLSPEEVAKLIDARIHPDYRKVEAA